MKILRLKGLLFFILTISILCAVLLITSYGKNFEQKLTSNNPPFGKGGEGGFDNQNNHADAHKEFDVEAWLEKSKKTRVVAARVLNDGGIGRYNVKNSELYAQNSEPTVTISGCEEYTSSTSCGIEYEMYMTEKKDSTIKKDTFKWDETPFLYGEFINYEEFINICESSPTNWKDPDKINHEGPTPPELKDWISLSNWDTVKKAGVWSVSATIKAVCPADPDNYEAEYQYTSFTVVKERPENKKGCPCKGCLNCPCDLPGDSQAAPTWSVNQVNMNLFVTDTPLWYDSPIDPSMKISLGYNSQSTPTYNEPFGNKWQFNYGSYLVDSGGSVTIYMPDGRSDVYTSDGRGGYTKPYQVSNTLTKVPTYYYRFELKFPDDTVYVYNVPRWGGSQIFIGEIKDSHGQKLTFNYDSYARLTKITDAMGRVTNLTYDNTLNLITKVTDPFGRSAAFEYDASRNLIKITDMGGYSSEFTYAYAADSNTYISSIKDNRGKWDFKIEPSDGNISGSSEYPSPNSWGVMGENYRITITNPLGGKEEYYYNSYKGYSWYISPRDYVEYVDYNNNNLKKAPKTIYQYKITSGKRGEIGWISYPGGGFVENLYDSTGALIAVIDPHFHVTSYKYNSMGNVTSTTDAKGITTTMTYAVNEVDLLKTSNGLGDITMTYNGTHDITSITDRLDKTTTSTYNEYGQLESQTDVLDRVTNYTYDANNYLQQVTRDGKTLESFTYDPIGRVKTHTDATGLTLTYDYNELNDIIKITYPDPDGKFVSYNYSILTPRLLDSMTDRSGRTTQYFYDKLKRLIKTVNPEGGITINEYDANGNMTKLIDPNGNATTFSYDLNNRLSRKTYADGKFILFYYDGSGLLTSRTNLWEIGSTSYAYDQNHNLLSVTYSDGATPKVEYQYDNFNRMTQRRDGAGTYNYTYDNNSRLTSVDGPWENDTLTYQYDAVGNRTSLTQQGGQTISYSHDALNRLTGIQMGTNTYAYTYSSANPLVQALTRPNGSVTNYSYDALNRLTGISNKNSASEIINQYVYGYNQQDVRSSETITNGNPITSFQNELITYNYNKVNQLLSSTNPAKNFTYDYNGNMTQGYTPEGYAFTASYDAENRLKSLEYTDSGGVVYRTEYIYSGDSFLAEMKKYENGALVSDTRFVRDDFLVLQERDGGNNVVREYTWGLDMGGGISGLLNLRQGGQDYSYLYDGKGNVTALLDSSQSVVATYTYDTFGNLMSKTGSLNQPFQFSTKQYDEKNGLSYYGYRFYSPTLGMWMTRDPLGETGGINLYEFVGNSPTNWIDSFGLEMNPQQTRNLLVETVNLYKSNPEYNKNKCKGFVCNTFVQEIFKRIDGSDIQGSAQEMYEESKEEKQFFTDRSQLSTGDIIYFDYEPDGKVDHVGIYIGTDAEGRIAFTHMSCSGVKLSMRETSKHHKKSKKIYKDAIVGFSKR